jgi:hypothetical protein
MIATIGVSEPPIMALLAIAALAAMSTGPRRLAARPGESNLPILARAGSSSQHLDGFAIWRK